MQPLLSGADRGSRARQSRPGGLSRLPPRRAADTGLSAAARAQPARQGARSQIAGQVPRVRSVEAGRRFGQVGAAERLSRAVPYASPGHEETRAAGARPRATGLIERAIAGRPQPARWLPRPRATGATRPSKTLHPTNDGGSDPRSIEPLTVDPRSRRPLTELCCPPVPP